MSRIKDLILNTIIFLLSVLSILFVPYLNFIAFIAVVVVLFLFTLLPIWLLMFDKVENMTKAVIVWIGLLVGVGIYYMFLDEYKYKSKNYEIIEPKFLDNNTLCGLDINDNNKTKCFNIMNNKPEYIYKSRLSDSAIVRETKQYNIYNKVVDVRDEIIGFKQDD